MQACVISKTPQASPPQKMARKALEEGAEAAADAEAKKRQIAEEFAAKNTAAKRKREEEEAAKCAVSAGAADKRPAAH